MEAIEFLEEAQRMCKSYADCKGCPLESSACGFIRCAVDYSDADIRCAIKVVEQWSKEHPIITNAKKFEEVFDISGYRLITQSADWWDEPYKEP